MNNEQHNRLDDRRRTDARSKAVIVPDLFLSFDQVNARVNGWLAELSVSRGLQSQFDFICLLLALRWNGRSKCVLLTKELGIAPHRLSRLLDRMNRAGYLQMFNVRGDRRCRGVSLSEAGVREADIALQKVETVESALMEALSAEELVWLNRILKRVLKNGKVPGYSGVEEVLL